MIEIEDPGPRATVQDLGRPGHAALGVGRSGAADRGALRLANRLVGNPEGLAGLELTLGGLRARFHRPALVAVTGAACPMAVDGANNDAGMNAPFAMRAGQVLRIGTPERGLRTYLAVRGGIDVPEVLGSRSTDTLSGIGPAIVARSMVLPVGRPASGFPDTDLAARQEPDGDEPLTVLSGPRTDWFTAAAVSVLTSNPYTVTTETDRIGARLDGPRIERAGERELPSEGMVRGALQVPPDGRPILFLADHPVTGGYPVIAVVRTADLDRAAQLRPGDAVRFRLADPGRVDRPRR